MFHSVFYHRHSPDVGSKTRHQIGTGLAVISYNTIDSMISYTEPKLTTKELSECECCNFLVADSENIEILLERLRECSGKGSVKQSFSKKQLWT